MDPLLGVARAEREVARLRSQLQSRADLLEQTQLALALAEADARVERARLRVESAQQEFSRLSHGVEELKGRMSALSDQEQGSDYRQLSHLEGEHTRVRDQIEEIEEAQLVALEQGELAQQEYADALDEREGARRLAEEASLRHRQRRVRVEEALEEALGAHEAQIAQLDAPLGDAYRRHVQVGRATSLVHGNICGNCDLSLSIRLLQAVAKASNQPWGERPRCEECGCVLVAEEGL